MILPAVDGRTCPDTTASSDPKVRSILEQVCKDKNAKFNFESLRKLTQKNLEKKHYVVSLTDNMGSVGEIAAKDLNRANSELIAHLGPPEARWVMVIGLSGVYGRRIPVVTVFGLLFDKESRSILWKGSSNGQYKLDSSGQPAGTLADATAVFLIPGLAKGSAVDEAISNLLNDIPKRPKNTR